MSCAELIQRVEAVRAPFGQERSIKFESGRLLDERILLSLHRSAFGPEPLAGVIALACDLGAPAAVVGAVASALPGADIVHFGYEGGQDVDVCKVYFEYAKTADAALRARQADRVLVHRAFKWDRRDPQRVAVTDYFCRPAATRSDVVGMVDAVAEAPVLHRLLSQTMARATSRLPSFAPMVLEVEEPGNPRKSLDINIYPAELRLADIADLIADVVSGLSVPPDRWAATLADHAGKTLGHVSAGRGRGGEAFATVYFGIEAKGEVANGR
ncbi:MAG: hypothetical protein P4L98_10170 [Ancalomicrobiaceae bacterium]|nr:hypothetical protein [Ancalomicrobiaceae bacterium]